MAIRGSTYTLLADCLSYPAENDLQQLGEKIARLQSVDFEIAGALETFRSYLRAHSRIEREELYTRTFDIQALCSLDIGYVLFGEDYKRGRFLVEMQREQVKAGNPCGWELPDHLPNVLRLLPIMIDRELAHELAEQIVIPALQKMLEQFKSATNPYRTLLETALQLITRDFTQVPIRQGVAS